MQAPQKLGVLDVWKMSKDAAFCSPSPCGIFFQVQNPRLLHLPWTSSGDKSFSGCSLHLPVLLSEMSQVKLAGSLLSIWHTDSICSPLITSCSPPWVFFWCFCVISGFCWSQHLVHFISSGLCGSEFGTYSLNPDFWWGPWCSPMTLQCFFTDS